MLGTTGRLPLLYRTAPAVEYEHETPARPKPRGRRRRRYRCAAGWLVRKAQLGAAHRGDRETEVRSLYPPGPAPARTHQPGVLPAEGGFGRRRRYGGTGKLARAADGPGPHHPIGGRERTFDHGEPSPTRAVCL